MNHEDAEKIRYLLSHSDPDYEQQGMELLTSIAPNDISLIAKGCSLRSTMFGKSSVRWSPKFTGWPNIQNDSEATSAMLMVLFMNQDLSVQDIQHLSLHSFNRVRNLDFLRLLPQLRSLSCTFCKNISNIEGLEGLTHLEKVDLFGTPVSEISPLYTLPRLLFLKLGYSSITAHELCGIQGLPKLVELELQNLPQLRSLHFISELPRLISLTVKDCVQITNVDGMRDLPKLRELSLLSCSALEQVDALSQCHNLKLVDLSVRGVWEPDWNEYMRNPHSLQSLTGLLNLEHLEKVNLSNQTLVPEKQIQQLSAKNISVCLTGYKDPQ